MACVSLLTPTLRTNRLLLRPFTNADADDLFALHTNALVLRYWDAPPWSDPARAERFIADCERMEEEGTGARLALEGAADGALLDWAFATLGLNRVQAETDTRNAASARVLEKLGFVREGTLREDCVVNHEVSDSWVFGLIEAAQK
jgi:RimJ/RimL family protein N-acetyltransferase